MVVREVGTGKNGSRLGCLKRRKHQEDTLINRNDTEDLKGGMSKIQFRSTCYALTWCNVPSH